MLKLDSSKNTRKRNIFAKRWFFPFEVWERDINVESKWAPDDNSIRAQHGRLRQVIFPPRWSALKSPLVNSRESSAQWESFPRSLCPWAFFHEKQMRAVVKIIPMELPRCSLAFAVFAHYTMRNNVVPLWTLYIWEYIFMI